MRQETAVGRDTFFQRFRLVGLSLGPRDDPAADRPEHWRTCRRPTAGQTLAFAREIGPDAGGRPFYPGAEEAVSVRGTAPCDQYCVGPASAA